jgi:ornithine cyclodeaminase/alanine dehydrogenase
MAGEFLYLSRADVEKVALPMAEMIAAMEAVFREKGEGRTEMPPKIGTHPAPEAYLNAMPARVASAGGLGIKWASIFAENLVPGLPALIGCGAQGRSHLEAMLV